MTQKTRHFRPLRRWLTTLSAADAAAAAAQWQFLTCTRRHRLQTSSEYGWCYTNTCAWTAFKNNTPAARGCIPFAPTYFAWNFLRARARTQRRYCKMLMLPRMSMRVMQLCGDSEAPQFRVQEKQRNLIGPACAGDG
jgi:hypothetical protein